MIGGVPRYLEEINPKLTAEQNIMNMAFAKEGILFNEFERIFSDLFSTRSGLYLKIVDSLTYGKKDFNGICEYIQHKKSGVISGYLEDLVKTGYLARDYTWSLNSGKESTLSLFRLKDNYLRFYLRYIAPNKNKILKDRFLSLPSWASIMGLQFENMVINNFKFLEKLLAIKPEEVVMGAPFFQRQTSTHRGCQIDYLVQTKFNTLYLCEIKFSKENITGKVVDDVKEKITRLKVPKNFSIRPVLIHVNGVSEAVWEEDFFANIIDFSSFLSEQP